ncbi:hypothetical protein DMH02_008270 [Streptomyces sp. WAC 00631]|nr:hypothetical protein [Streptomyces sp. WAC 00631]MCC5033215.1 hypothetical protein [Streptomyces sp. WAC 00631]
MTIVLLSVLSALPDGRPGLPHARAAVHALGSRRQTEQFHGAEVVKDLAVGSVRSRGGSRH